MTRKPLTLLAVSSVLAMSACAANTSIASTTDDTATAPISIASTTTPATQAQTAAPRPNVLLILFDDMGYGQLGITGHKIIKTPNIDKLAREGMLFANGYAGSTVCSPSRISLMTGRDSSRLHSTANTISLRPGDRTLAHLLSDAGYKTALFGKFGIGTTFGQTDPMTMGFQEWKGLLHNIQAHRQFPMFMFENNKMVPVPDNRAGARGGYAQRLFTDDALEYLDQQDGKQPFFALVSYTSPHSEMAAPEKFVAPYRGKFTETPYNGLKGPTPDSQFPDYYPLAIDEPNAVQAGMIAALDSYVGELVAKLEAQGLKDNTLILITSDNGPHSEGGGDPLGIAAAGPFRGGKRDLTEGGIHMPFIATWPSVIKSGRVEDAPVMFADLMPTLGDLAGRPGAAETTGANGVSLAPLLLNDNASLPERMLYWAFSRQLGDPNSGVIGVTQQAGRIGKWKALRSNTDAAVELYDLTKDPGEANDVATQYPKIAADFAKRFDAELEEQARYAQ
ncbi:sulfatase-like hydrolase/transferase [Altererythrobacter sp. RZ02]|uniref:Sulfatase-like hydrolase/transferase n=1 Tax=Pontixanthobacter rizhaonensis TaxID=2730337 RepID=A0A848QMV2_9SPHN|nr:sulfatase-like hydrolase/transferase [Pontixanthobacter rizhaonensis]NMW32013.1 sulfatase-like hydrolase/transferase [Pontixanthobacter rizhaonensis]